LTAPTNADGTFEFDDLAPGDYRVTKPVLSFLRSSTNEISITSAASDSDSTGHMFDQPGRTAQSLSLRDFTGSSSRDSIMASVAVGGQQEWYHISGDGWDDASQLTLELSQDERALTITITTAGGNRQAATLVAGQFQILASEGDQRLVKLPGSRSDFDFRPVANANAIGLPGEGEPDAARQTNPSGSATPTLSDATPTLVISRSIAEGEPSAASAVAILSADVDPAPTQLVLAGFEEPVNNSNIKQGAQSIDQARQIASNILLPLASHGESTESSDADDGERANELSDAAIEQLLDETGGNVSRSNATEDAVKSLFGDDEEDDDRLEAIAQTLADDELLISV
jgi:hypothetical protein